MSTLGPPVPWRVWVWFWSGGFATGALMASGHMLAGVAVLTVWPTAADRVARMLTREATR